MKGDLGTIHPHVTHDLVEHVHFRLKTQGAEVEPPEMDESRTKRNKSCPLVFGQLIDLNNTKPATNQVLTSLIIAPSVPRFPSNF